MDRGLWESPEGQHDNGTDRVVQRAVRLVVPDDDERNMAEVRDGLATYGWAGLGAVRGRAVCAERWAHPKHRTKRLTPQREVECFFPKRTASRRRPTQLSMP